MKRRKMKRVPFPLKQVLAKVGSSQNKLAEASGIPLPTINRMANDGNPTWSMLVYLAQSIGVSIKDFDPADLPEPTRRRRKVAS